MSITAPQSGMIALSMALMLGSCTTMDAAVETSQTAIADPQAKAIANSGQQIMLAKSGYYIDPVTDLSALLDCLDLAKIALISAHRGGPYPGYAENAISSFAQIAEHMPALLEIDVMQSRDGRLFLYHDWTLDQKSTGSGKPELQDWAALSRLELKDANGDLTGQHIPLLAEALDWAKGKAILQLDIKKGVDFAKIT